MNRFKGLDIIDRVPEELWVEFLNIAQEMVTKNILKKKKSQKAKILQGPCNMSCMQGFVFVLAHIKLIQSIEIILETRHSRNQ